MFSSNTLAKKAAVWCIAKGSAETPVLATTTTRLPTGTDVTSTCPSQERRVSFAAPGASERPMESRFCASMLTSRVSLCS